MWSIKEIFGRTTVQQTQDVNEGFAKGFDILQQEILRIGKMQGRDRTKTSVSLNNKNAPFDAGTKEWVLVKGSSLYIRYYDKVMKGCENLYVFTLDREKERYILQRTHEFDDAQEALSVFVNLLEDYADANFMRALKESLLEQNVVANFDGDSDTKEDELAQVKTPDRQAIIK